MLEKKILLCAALLLVLIIFCGCTSQNQASGNNSDTNAKNIERKNFQKMPPPNGMPMDQNFKPGDRNFQEMPRPDGFSQDQNFPKPRENFQEMSDENFLKISARILGLPENAKIEEINNALGIDSNASITEAKNALNEKIIQEGGIRK